MVIFLCSFTRAVLTLKLHASFMGVLKDFADGSNWVYCVCIVQINAVVIALRLKYCSISSAASDSNVC